MEDNIFVSYLRNEKGNRYKLFFAQKTELDENENPREVSVPRIEEYRNDLPDLEMKIVRQDIILSNISITINGEERLYSKIQLGMANMTEFNEKPQFYPQVKSFTEFH